MCWSISVECPFIAYSQTCPKQAFKTDQRKVLKTGGSQVQVESIAESIFSDCLRQVLLTGTSHKPLE